MVRPADVGFLPGLAMSCMIRKTLKAVLLLLPVLLVLIWPLSYRQRVDLPGLDSLNYPDEPAGGELFVRPAFWEGRLRIRYCRVVPGAPQLSRSLGPALGFYYQYQTDNRYTAGTFVERNIYLPIWFLILVTLPHPVVMVCGSYRRYRSRRKGLCPQCGYDLTGNVSGVCPECGRKL